MPKTVLDPPRIADPLPEDIITRPGRPDILLIIDDAGPPHIYSSGRTPAVIAQAIRIVADSINPRHGVKPDSVSRLWLLLEQLNDLAHSDAVAPTELRPICLGIHHVLADL